MIFVADYYIGFAIPRNWREFVLASYISRLRKSVVPLPETVPVCDNKLFPVSVSESELVSS